MKAYEFYVLLGKYKRMSLTRSEFDRFRTAIETVRSFRHSFYESTGEYYPVARRRSSKNSKTTPHPNARVLEATRPNRGRSTSNVVISKANEFVEQEWSGTQKRKSQSKTENKPEKKSDEKVTEILGQHQEFKRVRNHRRRKKFRWYRLGRDIAKHHPFKLFLSIVFLVAILIVAIIRPGFSNDFFRSTSDESLEQLKMKSVQSELEIESLTSGRFMSEADQLLAIDPKSFELNVETEMKTTDGDSPQPAVGVEQAIRDGLESRFSKPEEALPELDLPKIEPPQPTE